LKYLLKILLKNDNREGKKMNGMLKPPRSRGPFVADGSHNETIFQISNENKELRKSRKM
jgi:hypothetical protein